MMVCDTHLPDTPQKGKSVTNLLATDWLGNKDMFGEIRIDSRTAARILNKQIITVNKEINKDLSCAMLILFMSSAQTMWACIFTESHK